MASVQSSVGIFQSLELLYAIIKQFDSDKAAWPCERHIEVSTFRDQLGREGFHLTAVGLGGGLSAANISSTLLYGGLVYEIVMGDKEGYDENNAPLGNVTQSTHLLLGDAVDSVLRHLLPERPMNLPTTVPHPELKEGEMFIGNFTEEQFPMSRWETKRAGNVAYDIFGKPVKSDNTRVFPGFMKIEEYEAKFGKGSAVEVKPYGA